jgi:hypothetical protein
LQTSDEGAKPTSTPQQDDEPVVLIENPPITLRQWAVLILNMPNPRLKVRNPIRRRSG